MDIAEDIIKDIIQTIHLALTIQTVHTKATKIADIIIAIVTNFTKMGA